MFISAIRLGLQSLELSPLQPQRCNIDLCGLRLWEEAIFFFLSIISEAHCSVFGRLGYSLGFWVVVKELPLVFFLFVFFPPLTISMPTVKYPLYFRYVLNSLLFVFGFCVFVLKKKKKRKKIRRLPHVCPPCLCNIKEQTGCHFTTSATFSALLFASTFGCNMKSKGQRWRCIHRLWASMSYPWVSNSPLLVPSTSVVC